MSKTIDKLFIGLAAQKQLEADGGKGSGNFGHKGRKGQIGGSGEGGGSKETAKSIREQLIAPDSYVNSEDYQKHNSTLYEARKKRETAQERRTQIETALESESAPKPRSEWDDTDEFNAYIGKLPMIYTEKGAELQRELDKLQGEIKELDSTITTEGDAVKGIRLAERKKQLEEWEPTKPLEAKREDYQGFTTETTGVPYMDELMEKGYGYIAEMTPTEYLKRCAYDIFDGSATFESQLFGTDEPSTEVYAQMMRDGTKFDMPYLNYSSKNQEGRHRALAALMCGIDKIPCFVTGYNEDDAYWYHDIRISEAKSALYDLKEAQRKAAEKPLWENEEWLLEDM